MEYKHLRVTKRGLGKVVEISVDGKKWVSLETAYNLDCNFRMEFDIDLVTMMETG